MTRNDLTYPRIRVSGNVAHRSRQYGELARDQILAGREGYERNFYRSGLTWGSAVESSLRYSDAIAAAFPSFLDEVEGIAAGSGLDFEDVLTMNCRTEVMWARVNESKVARRTPGECSSFGLVPARTATGHTWIGQNWDWLVHAEHSVVVLEVDRPDGPNYVSLVEAGLLAKSTMNAAGIGVAVNTLITRADIGTKGIPFHVMLRALADIESVFDGLELLAAHPRASSANYLLGSATGAVLDVECEPGGVEGVHPLSPSGGLVTHTNHFVNRPRSTDLAPLVMSDSYVRRQRLHDLLQASPTVTLDVIGTALRDHVDFPGSICCHPDPRTDESEQWSTLGSMVMDLEDRVLHLSEGKPCTAPRRALDFTDLLASTPAQSLR